MSEEWQETYESGFDAGRESGIESRDDEVRDLEAEVQRLQRALMFWLPLVPSSDSPAAERCGDDAMLLGGYDGPDEECAEALGWITFNYASEPTAPAD